MNTKKIIITLLTLCTFFFFTKPVLAKGYGDHPWSFGIMSGLMVGAQFINEEDCASDSFWCGFMDEFYGSYPIMVFADYRFSGHFSLRGSLGIDYYISGGEDPWEGVYYDDMPRVFPAGEITAVWHMREKRSLFHPYALTGIRFPIANPEIGLGNQFNITNRFTFFIETALSTIPKVDFKMEGRLGIAINY